MSISPAEKHPGIIFLKRKMSLKRKPAQRRMVMKKCVLRILCVMTAVFLTAGIAAVQIPGAYADTNITVLQDEDRAIADGIIKIFKEIAQIPRPSGHEEKISSYLLTWAAEHGYKAERDDAKNVIFDVPASKGMENAPLTILQAHTDMIVAVEEGKEFDAENDPVTVIDNGTALTADGTSLGADDGMGIAVILYLIENCANHGPLRIIFTADEEVGATGVAAITKDTISGAEYLINVDSESSDMISIGSAAGRSVKYTADMKNAHPQLTQAMKIEIDGLSGGHSGMDIDKGKLNAIKAAGGLLYSLEENNIPFELSCISGGTLLGLIPSQTEAVVVINPDDEDAFQECIGSKSDILKKEYADAEKNMRCRAVKCEMPEYVFTPEWKERIIFLICNVFNGVNSIYPDGYVESSSSLGRISFSADNIPESSAETLARSGNLEKLFLITFSQQYMAEKAGFKTESGGGAKPWENKKDSRLLDMFKSAYKEVSGGEDIKPVIIHGGLEAAYFSRLDENLDIVSVGPDIQYCHSVDETCNILTLPKVYKTAEKVLGMIGAESLKN